MQHDLQGVSGAEQHLLSFVQQPVESRVSGRLSQGVPIALLRLCGNLLSYFRSDTHHVECHKTCLDCANGTKSGCTSCTGEYYLWGAECVTTCPDETYSTTTDGGKNLCLSCESPCETCTTKTNCTTCLFGFYTNPETNECVLAGDCPEGTYASNITRRCEYCDFSCLTCSGPTNKDCIICNFARGYAMSTGEIGQCYLMICSEGTFLLKNYTARTVTCQYCDKSCKSCDATGAGNCIECATGRTAFQSAVANRVYCKTCEEINSGLVTSADGGCKGSCSLLNTGE